MANWHRAMAAALLAGIMAPGWGSVTLSAAQAGQPKEAPVVLDRKAAARLLLNDPKPEYPALAKINFIQGHVRMKILVTEDGHVAEAHVVRGHPFLAAAALETVLRRWRYRPYRALVGLQEFVTEVEVIFSLRIKNINSIPPQPEEDLRRQVHPPRLLAQAEDPSPASSSHVRVLISSEGKVLDLDPAPHFPAGFEEMRQRLSGWRFQPARYGSLAVPWYLELQVSSEGSPTARPAPTD